MGHVVENMDLKSIYDAISFIEEKILIFLLVLTSHLVDAYAISTNVAKFIRSHKFYSNRFQ